MQADTQNQIKVSQRRADCHNSAGTYYRNVYETVQYTFPSRLKEQNRCRIIATAKRVKQKQDCCFSGIAIVWSSTIAGNAVVPF